MSEEQEQQSSEPVETVETQQPETPTLEDIAKKYGVEEQMQNFTAQPQRETQQTQIHAPSVPDPVTDLEGWNRYQQTKAAAENVLIGTIRELSEKVTNMEKSSAQQALNADVDKAVSSVGKDLDLDKDLIEFHLNKKYDSDPVFKRLWDSRATKPKALNEALSVIRGEVIKKYSIKADPQLAENFRAAKSSQKAMQQSRKEDGQNESIMKMDDAEFDLWSSRVKQGLA